jgi:hypothetical protein
MPRVHELGSKDRPLTDDEENTLTRNYQHNLTNRFAFGPLEAVTIANFEEMKFGYDVSTKRANVPGSYNVVIYCSDLKTHLRSNNEPVKRDRLDLAVTTLYDADGLQAWLERRGMSIVWQKRDGEILIILLRKNK